MQRLSYIRAGVAKTYNSTQWRSHMRNKPSPAPFKQAVESSANYFLTERLHVPARDMSDT